MGVYVTLVGQNGGYKAFVASNGAVCTTPGIRPAKDWSSSEAGQQKNLTEELKDASSSADMAVDGSSTAQEFYVAAAGDRIKWITEVRLVHHDSQMRLDSNEVRRFGSAAASPGLTNGVRLITRQKGEDNDVFTSDGVKNIGEYRRYAAIGGVTGLTDGVAAGTDILNVVICFQKPVGLFPGSKDKVVVQVQDDLSTMTLFEAVGIGWYELL